MPGRRLTFFADESRNISHLREVNTGQIMRPGILNDLKDPENHAYNFLRGIPEVQALLEQYR